MMSQPSTIFSIALAGELVLSSAIAVLLTGCSERSSYLKQNKWDPNLLIDLGLGLGEPISRRDFLNGTRIASAELLLHAIAPRTYPAEAFNGYGGTGDHHQSNGSTWDVLTTEYAMRDRLSFNIKNQLPASLK
jgi:hypothetical protein